MSDYSELKRLAEAATPGPWAPKVEAQSFCYYPSWTEPEQAGGGAKVCAGRKAICTTTWIESEKPQVAANIDYIAAASPDVVLALIAENERLEEEVERLNESVADISNSGTVAGR